MRHKVLFPFFALAAVILIVGLACGSTGGGTTQPSSQAPTQQQLTNPPPPPTATNTPLPPPTPNHAATQSAQATAAAAAKVNEIKQVLDSLGIPSNTGHLGWVQDKSASVHLDQPNTYTIAPFAEGVTAGDFVIQTDITFNTDSWPDCGFLFRADADLNRGAQYWFRVLRFSGLPLWELDFWRNGGRVSIITGNARASSDLKAQAGFPDTILFRADGNQFTVYINGVRQGRYPDFNNMSTTGRFGIYAMQNAGETTCVFEDTWIWIY